MSGLFAYFRGLPKVSGMRRLALWLALLLIFTVPWENAIHIAQVGRVSKAVGLAAFAVWAVSVLVRRQLRNFDLFQKAFVLFLIWNGLTLYWSVDSDATVTGFITYTELFAVLLLLWDLLDSEPAVKAALQAYVLGAFVASGSIIAAFFTAPASKFPEHLRVNALGYERTASRSSWPSPCRPPVPGGPSRRTRAFAGGGPPQLRVHAGRRPALALTGRAARPWPHPDPGLRPVVAATRRPGTPLDRRSGDRDGGRPAGHRRAERPLERIGTASTATEGDEGALAGRLGIWQASLRQLEQRR